MGMIWILSCKGHRDRVHIADCWERLWIPPLKDKTVRLSVKNKAL